MTIRLLIVQNILQHYRFDVFKELESAKGLSVEYVAGDSIGDGSIATIPKGLLKKVHAVRNFEFQSVLWQAGLIPLILQTNPDVVIFLGDSKYLTTWLAAIVMRLRRKTVFFWTIGWHRPDRGTRRLARLTFYRLAHHLLIYGQVGKKVGIDMGYPESRMTVIYNSSSSPIPGSHSRSIEEFNERLPSINLVTITAVIRLNKSKQLDMLIEAAAALKERNRPVSVLIVGEGPDRKRLEALARQRDVSLHLPGPAYSIEELSSVYERSVVTVIPTGAGLSTLQSLKHGVPVITHDFAFEQMPESEAIIPGLNGALYEHGSLQSLTDTIEVWLDRQSLNRMVTAAHCRATVNNSWSAVAQSQKIVHQVRIAQELKRRHTDVSARISHRLLSFLRIR